MRDGQVTCAKIGVGECNTVINLNAQTQIMGAEIADLKAEVSKLRALCASAVKRIDGPSDQEYSEALAELEAAGREEGKR